MQFSTAWRRKTRRKGTQKCTAKGQETTDLRATRGTDAHKEPNAVAPPSLEGSRPDRTPEALLSPLELALQGRRLGWRPPRAPSTLCLSDIPRKTTKPISFPQLSRSPGASSLSGAHHTRSTPAPPCSLTPPLQLRGNEPEARLALPLLTRQQHLDGRPARRRQLQHGTHLTLTESAGGFLPPCPLSEAAKFRSLHRGCCPSPLLSLLLTPLLNRVPPATASAKPQPGRSSPTRPGEGWGTGWVMGRRWGGWLGRQKGLAAHPSCPNAT